MEIDNILNKLNGRKVGVLGEKDFFRVSVLLPLIVKDGETHILFEVRASHLRRQPNEVCFPGGKFDAADRNAMACAVRETTEELGIKESDISNIIPLDYLVNGGGTIVYPFVGKIDDLSIIRPNPDEVGEIFTVPLSYLLNTKPAVYKLNFQVQPEEGFPYDLIIGGENYKWQIRQMDEYFYEYDGNIIWGLTARVLTHFLDLIK
ncbi:CoA pyrophosphatase [Bacillus sp. B15-48]|uniref:NUDIX hydrolase n=1 Tax=Bacillus sp. B15-48 TaxID=1548601 RepID=UPI00193F1925|nr:CoA pyrophosphatase [Bacillus sp. B15-48]MBM4763411.1 NUDIX domain-containing protein [Bacillus sp. B15-48]